MRNLLITGGTGTLGTALLNKAIQSKKFDKIAILSRDENKQQEMKKHYPDVLFIIGDVRDSASIGGITDVFHCAALKHVDLGEIYPAEFERTNYAGTINTLSRTLPKNFCFFSTDKAVLPINAYGFSKAMAEKALLSFQSGVNINIYRWGNIVGSRGSAIPNFVRCVMRGDQIPVTDKRMTRFWLTIEDAADYVFETFEAKHEDQPLICPKIKSAPIMDVIDAIGYITGLPISVKEVGIRPGEKMHECLRSGHDFCVRSDNCAKYSMDELIELIRPTVLAVTNG
jgi:UDP-N-acetylglucosamine 4,6-dehydratase/5-epimerase